VKLKISIAVIAALALAIGVSAAQAASVASPVNVTHDDSGDNELDIAINPTNPSNMIAGWNDYGVGNSCGVGWTTNGGKTWQTDWLRGMTPAGGNPTYDYGAGDPSVGFLDDGTAIFTCNAWSIKKPTAIYVTTSADGGKTWAAPQQVASAVTKAGNLDHPMMTIDHYNHRALLAYTTWSGHQANSWALISNASGTAWSGPYRIAADFKSNAPDVFDVSLAGAPDGTVYATSGIWQHVNEWSEQAVVVSQLRPGETAFTRSVKVRDLVPAPMTLPGEGWRTSMQGIDRRRRRGKRLRAHRRRRDGSPAHVSGEVDRPRGVVPDATAADERHARRGHAVDVGHARRPRRHDLLRLRRGDGPDGRGLRAGRPRRDDLEPHRRAGPASTATPSRREARAARRSWATTSGSTRLPVS
jgi:hypothetical protein